MYQSADSKYQRFVSFLYHISFLYHVYLASFQEVSVHLSHSGSQIDGIGTILKTASCHVEGKRVLQYLASAIKYLTPKWHAELIGQNDHRAPSDCSTAWRYLARRE